MQPISKKKLIPLYKYERTLRKKLLETYHHQVFLGVTKKEAINDSFHNLSLTDDYQMVIGKWKTPERLIRRLIFSYHTHNGKPILSTGDKVLALAILRQNPKIYHFLRTIFKLPDPKNLIQLSKTPPKTDIISKIMSRRLLNKLDCEFRSHYKLCTLLFGEVKMRNFRKQKKDIYIQVFMIRGLVHKYRQAVAYTFSNKPITPPQLAKQLKIIIKQLRNIGFRVLATVCKHSSKNRQAITLLKKQSQKIHRLNKMECKEDIFLVNPQEVIPIFDPPHLLMSTRDQLIKNDLVYTKNGKTGTAKWNHIVLMEKENNHVNNFKLISKLFYYHVTPEKIKRDSLTYATTIFSQRLAAWMAQLSGTMTTDNEIRKRIQKLPMESRETAELIVFFNNLFDSLSGEKEKSDYDDFNKFLKPLTLKSQHYKCWTEAVDVLKTMFFVNKDGRQIKVPEIQCWIETIKGMFLLISKLWKRFGVNSLWTRRVSLDPLASYFKAVRDVRRPKKKRNIPYIKVAIKHVKKKSSSPVSTSCLPF